MGKSALAMAKGRLHVFVLLLMTLMLATACGGGGSSSTSQPTVTTVSGVAASGAPIVGFAYLRDSASPATTLGPTTIGTDGSFSFDVDGLTAPFIIKVEGSVGGQSVELISAAVSAGTANVNPITNLAVASATGETDPSAVFDDPSAYSTDINQTNLNTAVAEIQTMLQSLLDAYNATSDPLTGDYAADHTGLDAVLDVVTISLDTTTGAVAVESKTTGNTIGSGEVGTTGLTNVTEVATSDVPAIGTVDDLQAIGNTYASFLNTVNSKGVNLSTSDLDPYFASESAFGINDGFGRADSLTQWTAMLQEVFSGRTVTGITGLALVSIDSGVYTISGNVALSDGSGGSISHMFTRLVNEGGSWKFVGNGHIAWAMVYPHAQISVIYNGQEFYQTGIGFEVQDDANQGIKSLLITGPGLPGGGLTYIEDPNNPGRLCYDYGSYCDYVYAMDDSTIGSIADNSTYTIVYKDISGNTLETREFTIQKRPYKLTELTSSSFPSVNLSSHFLSAANYGGTFSFTYSLPTEYVTTWLHSELEFGDNSNQSLDVDKALSLTQSSASLTSVSLPSLTPTWAYFHIASTDQYERDFYIHWEFR